MGRQRKPTAEEFLRLDAVAKYLKVKSRYPQATFTADVIKACLCGMAPVVDRLLPCTGEEISLGLGEHLCVTFEEVHGPHDVVELEDRYLKGKKEIGFAQLRGELERPGVDALLFERMNADEEEADRFVAVLNLQDSDAKAYWNRYHELSHRIAEPPQRILPLRRHQFEASNPVEALIDAVAAEFAFYEPAFRPLVMKFADREKLDFDVVGVIRGQFAPTASLLSTIKAIVRFWPYPAAVIVAEFRGRFGAPDVDCALRVSPQGYNSAAGIAGLAFFSNMRVPPGSPIELAFRSGMDQSKREHLGNWGTSRGKRLTGIDVYTSARRIGKRVYAVISVEGGAKRDMATNSGKRVNARAH
jgi:hypothetical protein